MDRPPDIPRQDRADYEHVLNRALADPGVRSALRKAGAGAPGTERLRALARGSTAVITAAASTEFERYVEIRLSPGRPAADRPESSPARERAAGVAGVLASLIPILAGTTAAILYLLGVVLGMAESRHGLEDFLTSAAMAAAVVAGLSLTFGLCGLLVTASRGRAAVAPSDPSGRPTGRTGTDTERAREDWLTALLDRGMIPFLLGQVNTAPDGLTTDRVHRPGRTSPALGRQGLDLD
ncbi:hypothetical protein [Kitasatospora sp. NPDC059327]|uniref:hypothetical protein n=1 Tax=Kitasatospora sp. NPDC059327 TaxID=3346803 RepID=UPI0036C8B3B0